MLPGPSLGPLRSSLGLLRWKLRLLRLRLLELKLINERLLGLGLKPSLLGLELFGPMTKSKLLGMKLRWLGRLGWELGLVPGGSRPRRRDGQEYWVGLMALPKYSVHDNQYLFKVIYLKFYPFFFFEIILYFNFVFKV
jgi:hypothetical protein